MSVDVEKIVREYLPDVIHMSLASCKDSKPWVCEVHYAYDEDLNVYFFSTPSSRHSLEIAGNASVAGSVVRQHQLGEPRAGVYFEGTAKELGPGQEQDKALACYVERLSRSKEDLLKETKQPDGHQFYKITVANWYVFGKLEGDKTQKYQLVWNGGRK